MDFFASKLRYLQNVHLSVMTTIRLAILFSGKTPVNCTDAMKINWRMSIHFKNMYIDLLYDGQQFIVKKNKMAPE